VEHTDVDLLKLVKQGDAAALADYTQLKRPQLLAYIGRQLGYMLRSKVETEDLAQETILRALQQKQLFTQSDRDPFGTLCHLAQETIIDTHRRLVDAQKRAAEREVPLQARAGATDSSGGIINLLVASMTSASQAMSRNDKELRMWSAIGELPEEQRVALQLRYVDGLATKEIAERLGKSDGSIRVLLTRSLDKLQKILE
jgi:RNA polymerase sigma-70 factor, ECF subfamily